MPLNFSQSAFTKSETLNALAHCLVSMALNFSQSASTKLAVFADLKLGLE